MKHFRMDNCTRADEWNEFVSKHGTVHHLFEWTFVNRETFGCPCINLACWNGDRIVAIYPYIIRGRWPLRWYVSPTDFGGGPVGDPNAVRYLLKEVHRRARRQWISMNTIRYDDYDISGLRKFNFEIVKRHNLVIDLDRPEDEIWHSFRDKIRNSIRKSKKQEIEVIEGKTADLDAYLDLADRHSAAIGYRPRSRRFIRALFKHLDTTLLIAKWQGNLVGGCVYLKFDGWASGIHAARDPDKTYLRIGEAIHWAGMNYFKQRNYTQYDFMSRNDNHIQDGQIMVYPSHTSLHRFKSGWGPLEVPNYDLTIIYFGAGLKLRRGLAGIRNRMIPIMASWRRRVNKRKVEPDNKI